MNLEAKAAELRRTILETALKAGKGHLGPALSWVEIGVALHYGVMKTGDRFILSKGHGSLALYAILADLGLLASSELERFGQAGALLAGHPDHQIPGVDVCSGSLGHGLGVGAGMALANKLDGNGRRVFVLLGDGELHEGSIWEAAMFASHHRLNLTAIVDWNKLCSADLAANIIRGNFATRFSAFGWDVLYAGGHDICDLTEKLMRIPDHAPTLIMADTIKGKGVSFMEGNPKFHHGMPNPEQVVIAREELR